MELWRRHLNGVDHGAARLLEQVLGPAIPELRQIVLGVEHGRCIAAAILAGTIVAIRAYDPSAFTLRSAEDFEHKLEAGHDARSGSEDDGQEKGADRD
jgi:hypothetical protein